MIPNHKDLRSQVSFSESAVVGVDEIATNGIPGLPNAEAKAGGIDL